MMKKILFILIMNLMILVQESSSVFASPSPLVIDTHQRREDIMAMTDYYAQIITTDMYKLGQVADIGAQIASLKSLQDVEKVGGEICQLCSKTEQKQLQTYIGQVNDDLCSQFSVALKNITGIQQAVKSVDDVIKDLQSNPKAAGLALQNAAVRTQAAIQTTLAQIQVLVAQREQKHLAEEKLEKQNSEEIYTGFGQSGL